MMFVGVIGRIVPFAGLGLALLLSFWSDRREICEPMCLDMTVCIAGRLRRVHRRHLYLEEAEAHENHKKD